MLPSLTAPKDLAKFGPKRLDFKSCPGCSKDHAGLAVRQLALPAGGYTHRATCPATGVDFLIRAEDVSRGA